MTDAEIANHMGWRGPGAYTQHQMRKIKMIVHEVQNRERDKVANWMMHQCYATGRGETIEDLLDELKWQINQNIERAAQIAQEGAA